MQSTHSIRPLTLFAAAIALAVSTPLVMALTFPISGLLTAVFCAALDHRYGQAWWEPFPILSLLPPALTCLTYYAAIAWFIVYMVLVVKMSTSSEAAPTDPEMGR